MRAAKKARFDKKILQDLVPLNALSDSRFGILAEKILVEEIKSGHYLFRKGDRDGRSIYLLDGKINLIDGFRKVAGEVRSGTETAYHPIANQQPRPLSAKAARKSVIASVDSNLLDVFLACDQTQTADVVEIDGADTGDWMTRILQSEVFSKLPPSKIQSLLMKMRPVTYKAGDMVIRQGDEGDYFYTIHEGRCQVSRTNAHDGGVEVLAELSDGDTFGEDALVSNTCRNATVTMLTDGTLMRLAQSDFNELLRKQLVKHIDCETACAMVKEGAVWLDVRTPDEYERGAIEESVNIPLAGLRDELSELVFNATYILCCDTGGRSGSAAFMLSHKGFDVYVLEGGLSGLNMDQLAKTGMPVPQMSAAAAEVDEEDCPAAEVMEFQSSGSGQGEDDSCETSPEVATVDENLESAAPEAGDSAERQRMLAELQQEKSALLAELQDHREAKKRLSEQLELLREELGESGEKLGELYSQTTSDAEEKQILRDQYAALQEEYEQQRRTHTHELHVASSRIDELNAQIETLRLEAQAGAGEAGDELDSARADNEQLRQDLVMANERSRDLEAQLEAVKEAGSRQQSESESALGDQLDRIQQLQTELQHLGAENDRLQRELAATGDQGKAVTDEISGQLSVVEDRLREVTGELDEVRSQYEQKCADLENESARVSELEQSKQDLIASLESVQSSAARLEADFDSVRQQNSEALEQLQTDLTAASHANERLQRDLDEAVAAREAVREEMQGRIEKLAGQEGQNNEELVELQQKLNETSRQLASEQERAEKLQQQNHERAEMLESLQAEIAAARGEKESIQNTALQQQREFEDELASVKNELEQLIEHSRAAESGLASTTETLRELEQDKQTLNASLQISEARVAELGARMAELEREKRDAIDALSAQEKSHGQEVALLNETVDAARQTIAQHQSGLEELQAEKHRLEDELRQQLSRNHDLKEEYEARLSESGTATQKAEEELAVLQAEYQDLQQQIESQNEKFASDSAEKDRRIEELHTQLGDSQEEALGLRSSIGERDEQLESLQREIADRDVSRQLLEEQLETSREQQNQLRQEIEQLEQHARDTENEYQQSVREAHDELARKNENEKELQGQIDRLRKQLEQATLDLHKKRESAQSDIDNLREQIQAERRARDEERAEMAARQRELKEQLASIASEHEANLGGNTGSLEEARSEIRAEEQERLREVLEAQAQSEDQLIKLQKELREAHEEIAELVRNQKDLRQLDAELLQEQNQQAASTISQLESQLRQLTEDRDSGLEKQNELRERMNSLRGEVEVARGLLNMHGEGRANDLARLRADLDESRKNVEIAVRLRAEAEAARERILKERDQLRSQLLDVKEAQKESPASGRDDKHASTDVEEIPTLYAERKIKETVAGHPEKTIQQQHPASHVGRQRRIWLGVGVGFGLTGLIVLAIWILLTTPRQFPDITAGSKRIESAEAPVAGSPGTGIEGSTAALVAVKPTATPGAESVQAPKKPDGKAPATPKPAPKAVTEERASTTDVAAVRTFRDKLNGGIEGPVMVELPAATFNMGSRGNSLNYDEIPLHEVTLGGFSISKYEVTFEEYDRFARATGRGLPSAEGWGRGSRPVINVSWKDAQAYTEWLSAQTGKIYRLPTEAEWEYANRAGVETLYWWDFEPEGVYANCFDCGSEWDGRQTAPVGSFAANRFGLHDMAGNVQEWTQDCYKHGYEDAPRDGSAWVTPACTQRSVRGGGYTSPLDSLRSAKRAQYNQETRIDNIGFRVVRNN